MQKYLIVLGLLFITFLSVAQSDSVISSRKSVISLDKVKTVYRGIVNPISIAVSDCKSFTVEGLGVREVSQGTFALIPGAGNEAKITVKITNFDDSVSVEEHVFSIRNFTNAVTTINDNHCAGCYLLFKKEEIKDAVIGVNFKDFKFDYEAEVVEFTIRVPKKKGIVITGNTITEEVYIQLKKNQLIVIYDIKTKFLGLGNILICRIPPILIKVD